MEKLQFVLLSLITASVLLMGCGSGHPTITSITVTPASATAPSSSQGQTGFSATGNFSNGKSRLLTVGDGLSWSSSNIPVVSITSLGLATCKIPGTATITASAPANVQITVGTGVNNTAATVSGTATLTCT